MKVSVAMTTYNGEKYIEQQLLSLFHQTRKIDEVIIMDDQSSDGTEKIVRAFIEANHLTHWSFSVNETNVGFVQNFLNCIEATSGDLIFLCDQDDIWEPQKIEWMSGLMEERKEITVLNSAVRLVDKEGKAIVFTEKKGMTNGNILHRVIQPDEIVKFDFLYLACDNISPGCTMGFTKQIKEQIGAYRALCIESNFPHDWAINMLAAASDGTYYWNRPCIRYRIHENNTIGLALEEKKDFSMQIKGTREIRIENARNLYRLRKFSYDFMQKSDMVPYKEIERNFQYALERLRFLENLSVRGYLKLFKYRGLYRKNVGVKGILSDLLYAVKLDGVFRR